MNLSDGKTVYVQTQTVIDGTLPLSDKEIHKCIDLSLKASALELLLPFAVNVRIVGYHEVFSLNNSFKKEI